MPEILSITVARRTIGDVVTAAVVHHRPVPIERNRRDQALVLGRDDILRLVSGHEFHPEVFSEEGAVSIWLPEFALYGRGGSFVEAQEDLLDEVRLYVDGYVERAGEFLRAPNRAHHYPWVLRALIAEMKDELAEVLFAEPAESSAMVGLEPAAV